jgi:AcrR family transcriptional regulator
MPKHIKDARLKIMQATRERLLSKETGKFSLHDVAADCDIAVGTIYNYFPDKEELVLCVMRNDWEDMFARMDDAIGNSREMSACFRSIYRSMSWLRDLSQAQKPEYDPWKNVFDDPSRTMRYYLRKELEKRMHVMFRHFHKEKEGSSIPALAELMIDATLACDLEYRDVEALVNRLYKGIKA